jgi:hypothetical protein
MPSVPLTQDPQLCFPSAAAHTVIAAGGGSAWTSSAYVEMEDSLAVDAYLTGISAHTAVQTGLTTGHETDIAVGTAGNEVVVGTFKNYYKSIANDPTTSGLLFLPSVALMDCFSSGDRVSARGRWNSTDTSNWRIKVSYMAKPLTGAGAQPLITSEILKCYPSAANDVAFTTPASSWTSTSYTEIRAASGGVDWYLMAFVLELPQGSTHTEMDLATGTAGNEVVVKTFHQYAGNSGNIVGLRTTVWVPIELLEAERLSVRFRNSGAIAQTGHFNCQYFEALP